MPYVVTFNCGDPTSIYKYLQSINGVEVFSGCWVARYDGTIGEFIAILKPCVNDADGLLVANTDAVLWHSRTPEIAVRAVLDGVA